MLHLLFIVLIFFAEQALADAKRPGSEVGKQGLRSTFDANIYDSVQEEASSAPEFLAAPDRWRQFYMGKWFDPYNQNVLKGDIPIFGSPGEEWFLETSIISDSLFEYRKLPTSVGSSTTQGSNSNDVFGDFQQTLFVENIPTRFSLIRGNTTFKPPEFELRISPVFNINHASIGEVGGLRADPARGSSRDDAHVGFQELFIDTHLFNLSHRYDFVSSRVGLQRFTSDFRGFVYSDDAPGVRFFGNWDSNKYQYNLAWFDRLDKDTNSGLNTSFRDRNEQVVVANLYANDRPVLGHNLNFSIIHREDNAGSHQSVYDRNGFLVRPAAIGDEMPKNISNTYLGLNGDGHFGRVNTTSAFYYTFGSESHNAIAHQATDISAFMTAQEISYDVDWIRYRGSFFFSSGDSDPYDNKATGFDSISDLPNFAGGDLSYWQRQGIPFIGGGGVALVNRLSLLPSLRAGKEQGQANFVNPGLLLYNAGVDFEITPKLKLINNLSYLRFSKTDVLQALRQDGSIDNEIGWDISSGFLYRPFLNNNIQVRLGVAALLPGKGLKNLYGNQTLYDVFTNLIFAY